MRHYRVVFEVDTSFVEWVCFTPCLQMCSMLDVEVFHPVAIAQYIQLNSSRKKVAYAIFFSLISASLPIVI